MATCPDNSTECLLRALLDANSGFNWNPLNFAFTAAIGALALIIACTTVFQGLLAAGPGRLKANKSAIGEFAKGTKTRFDWTEFALRSTAYVPVLRLRDLEAMLVNRHFENSEDRTREAPQTTATWHLLLQRSGILRHPDLGRFKLIPRATDYLPADVQAAPAAAELRCLILLAIMSDYPATIEGRGRTMKAVGPGMQLTLREHPILGLVAAFESFEEKNLSGDLQRRPEVLDLAAGVLSYKYKQLLPKHEDNSMLIWDDGPMGAMKVFLGDLRKLGLPCQQAGCKQSVEFWGSTPIRRNYGLDFFRPLALLVADNAGACRAFPYRSAEIGKAVQLIAECAVVWTEEEDYLSTILDPCGVDLSSLRLPAGMTTYCLRWVKHQKSMLAPQNPSLGRYPRFGAATGASLLLSLSKVDGWLQRRQGPEYACVLYRLLGVLSEKTKFFGSFARAGFLETEYLCIDKDVEDGLRAMIVFRGILVALTLDYGCDTSVLWEDDFPELVVKVL
ncbi:hypothetical protein LTR62_008581 [Meristemomyces frigidus]|uniref:Uncharacterized protein n=1 Tax=Meristemomyces frigidus TaxID=1508187 RepID=A0AAN7YM92_9PEZI|nr:hypothetical protein LTR62_008581 [Meristemomyces frigidus]